MPDFNKEIILVGNGPSILRQPFGNLIDQFGTVVRFNKFCPRYYQYTGRKINIWATTNPYKQHSRKRELIDWKQWPTILHITKRNETAVQKLEQLAKEQSVKYIRVPVTFLNELDERVQRYSKEEVKPSSGLAVAAYYLEYLKVSRIYIHGFDHLQPGKQLHYWQRKILYPRKKYFYFHRERIERKFFKEWEQEKRVIRLWKIGNANK